uniref:uncharacterized protein isoform X2 n=1 Tax=Myxine glutinosa TaxID=7769 RepID=UPI00358E5018
MYAQVGCWKDSCGVQLESEQPTVLECGIKVEELEESSEILQIKIEDVNSFGLEEEQSDQLNDLFVKVEVKTEHEIDVHMDQPEPNDAEASFFERHPHEGDCTESKKKTTRALMNSTDTSQQESPTETSKRTLCKHNKPHNEMFPQKNFHSTHKGEKAHVLLYLQGTALNLKGRLRAH